MARCARSVTNLRQACCAQFSACHASGGYKRHEDHTNDANVDRAAKFAVEKVVPDMHPAHLFCLLTCPAFSSILY